MQTTRAGNRYGAYASNTGPVGGAGGAACSPPVARTPAYVTTAGVGASAVLATQYVPAAAANGNEAAVTAIGGAGNGVVATTANEDAYALASAHLAGGIAALGSSDGGIGVFGVATAGGSGLWGRADDGTSYALTADGTALFLGNVVVQGTLYAPTVVNTLPPGTAGLAAATTSSGRRLAARAAKKAVQLRAQLGDVGGSSSAPAQEP